MTINKYQGKTKEEAVEKAKQELGAGAVVLNVKEIKPKGMFKMFKNTLYEVTAAVEEKEAFPAQTLRSETKPVHDTISLAADEKIAIRRQRQMCIRDRFRGWQERTPDRQWHRHRRNRRLFL